MALTGDIRETIRRRARRQPAFRKALKREAAEQMLAGDVETAKSLVRNYLKREPAKSRAK